MLIEKRSLVEVQKELARGVRTIDQHIQSVEVGLRMWGFEVLVSDGSTFCGQVSGIVPNQLMPYVLLDADLEILPRLFLILRLVDAVEVAWSVSWCETNIGWCLKLQPIFSSTPATKQQVRDELTRLGKALQELEL